MNPRPRPSWRDETRILLRSAFWLVGLAVLAVLALSLAAELGNVCYTNCAVD